MFISFTLPGNNFYSSYSRAPKQYSIVTATGNFCQIKNQFPWLNLSWIVYQVITILFSRQCYTYYYTNTTQLLHKFKLFMNPEILSQLRSMLPRGSRCKIKASTKYSLSYIDQVLKGIRHSPIIESKIFEIMEELLRIEQANSIKYKTIVRLLKGLGRI
jgi:hypothetical protein